MGEIVQLQIGQTGNRIGSQFWKQLLLEHNINLQGSISHQDERKLLKINTFFQENNHHKYRPRAISIDMDTKSLQQIITSPLVNFYNPQNFCYHTTGTQNLWSAGYNSGKQIVEEIIDCIRLQVQSCDHLGGFNCVQSLIGGTGSGLTSLILQKIEQMYSKSMIVPFSIIPSPNLTDLVIQPYNAALALKTINTWTGQPCILFDNQSFFKTKMKKYQMQNLNFSIDYKQINKEIGKGMANFTSPMRFPCDGNIGYLKMSTNLIQYPFLKYFLMSMPFTRNKVHYQYNNIGNLIKNRMLHYKNWSLTVNQENFKSQKWVACYYIFRGEEWSPFDVNCRINKQMMRKIYRRYGYREFKEADFVKQLPYSYIACCVKQTNQDKQNSVTSIQLNSIIKEVCNNLYRKVTSMSRKRAFMHWYLAQGMEAQQINEAQTNLLDIVNTYQEITEVIGCGGQQYNDGSSVQS